MILDGEMLKDEVAQGAEAKREDHLTNIWSKYQKLSQNEK